MTARILIINDDPGLVDLLTSVLHDEGYEAGGLIYPNATLDSIGRLAPDLILLDLSMGDEIHGWSLLTKLRLYQPTMAIPVVICAYFPGDEILQNPHFRRQQVWIVPMPPDLNALLHTIAAALAAPAAEPTAI